MPARELGAGGRLEMTAEEAVLFWRSCTLQEFAQLLRSLPDVLELDERDRVRALFIAGELAGMVFRGFRSRQQERRQD